MVVLNQQNCNNWQSLTIWHQGCILLPDVPFWLVHCITAFCAFFITLPFARTTRVTTEHTACFDWHTHTHIYKLAKLTQYWGSNNIYKAGRLKDDPLDLTAPCNVVRQLLQIRNREQQLLSIHSVHMPTAWIRQTFNTPNIWEKNYTTIVGD